MNKLAELSASMIPHPINIKNSVLLRVTLGRPLGSHSRAECEKYHTVREAYS